jgi:hypothetical protein
VLFAVALFARQAVRLGHEAVVEGQLRGGQRPHAHLVDLAADDQAREVALDQEDRQLAIGAPAATLAKTVKKSATGAEVTQVLRPLQHVAAVDLAWRVVAMPPRSEPALGSVMQMAPIFSPLQRRLEQALDDVGVAQHVQELGAHQRLHRRRPASDIEPRAISSSASANSGSARPLPPTVLGVTQPEEAQLGQLEEQRARERMRLVQRRRLRHDALVDEAREGVADRALVVR